MHKHVKATGSVLFLLLCIYVIAGCTTIRHFSPTDQADGNVTVVLFDGQRIRGKIVSTSATSVVLQSQNAATSQTIALNDIRYIEQRRFSGLKTAGLVVASVASVVLIAVAIDGVPIGYPAPP